MLVALDSPSIVTLTLRQTKAEPVWEVRARPMQPKLNSSNPTTRLALSVLQTTPIALRRKPASHLQNNVRKQAQTEKATPELELQIWASSQRIVIKAFLKAVTCLLIEMPME